MGNFGLFRAISGNLVGKILKMIPFSLFSDETVEISLWKHFENPTYRGLYWKATSLKIDQKRVQNFSNWLRLFALCQFQPQIIFFSVSAFFELTLSLSDYNACQISGIFRNFDTINKKQELACKEPIIPLKKSSANVKENPVKGMIK